MFDPEAPENRLVGGKSDLVGGEKVTSFEVLEIGIHWDASDKQIIEGFKMWLMGQRQKNANARFFKAKGAGRGKRVSAVSVLMALAMLRARDNGLSREETETALLALGKRAACRSRLGPKYYAEAISDAEEIFR